MKPINQITNKNKQQNIHINQKNIEEKSDNYYNNISSIKRLSKYNESEKNKLNYHKNNNNVFISISDFPENNDRILDNNNYKSIIKNSLIWNPYNNKEKIKSVNANNYLNKENNPIISFNDLKLSILTQKHSFNSPFIFCRNGVDLANTKKLEEEKNYQMKRYRHLKNYKYSFNPSIRRENSKIIQKWWKKEINPKIIKRKKVTQLQAAYRGYITRKHLNDIIWISVIYQNFINKLRKVLSNFVRRNYFPKRYYKKKYALEKIFPLKLKLFFRKWKKYKNNCDQKEKAAENMIKTREKNRYILVILKSFFNIWKIKCQEIILNEKGIKLLNDKDKKYFAIAKLFNKAEQIGKRKAFDLSKNNLRKYLMYIFQKKYVMKLLNYYKKYKLEKNLKKYFDKWRNSIYKQKEKTLKAKILTNEIKNQTRLNDKENLRNQFNNLRAKANLQNIKDLNRAKKNFLFPQGGKHISNFVRKYIFREIFKKYARQINLRKKLSKIIINSIKKYYLYKWKAIIQKEKYNEKRKNNLKKIISILSHLNSNKILSKYYFKWKSNILIDKFGKNKINIYSKLCKGLLLYTNKKNIPNKKYILQKIRTYINPGSNTIKKRLLKIIKNYISKDRKLKLQKVINKWQKFSQFKKLNDLKAKNLETVARLSKAVYNSKRISKSLYEWKEKNNLLKFINKSRSKDNINDLINCLKKLKNRRMKLLFDCLRKAKNNLLKKIIIKNIYINNMKRVLKNKFNLWKLNSIKQQNKYKLANIDKLNKLKIIVNNAIKNKDKSNYTSLKKALNKWYLISKLINKDNYNKFLKNIKIALGKINNVCVNISLKESFDKLNLTGVNEKNIILKRLKKYFSKNDNINLRKAFIKFFTVTKKQNEKLFKANILFNLKQKNYQTKDKIYMTKYFNRWKLLNKFLSKERILATKNITNLLNNSTKKKIQKNTLDRLKYIRKQFYLNEYAKILFKLYELIEKRCLCNNLRKWKNISKKINFNISQRQKGYEIIFNTLSKAFSYKKSFEILSSLLKKHQEKNYKIFLDKYKAFFQKKINFKYQNKFQNNKKPKKIHFEFKKTIKPNLPLNSVDINNKKENIKYNKRQSKNKISNRIDLNNNKKEKNKNIVITIDNKNKFYKERLIPYLVKYLNKLRLKRLKIAFEKLNYFYKINSFCKLFTSWNKSQNILSKKKLINNLNHYIIKQNILDYMRKTGIKKLTSFYLVVTKRRNDLFILVHLTKVFKRISQLKKAARFLKLWKLYIKLIKEREAQLRKMEKSFSQTYEKLSDDIFVDIGDEKSVQTQMLTFVDKVNYGNVNPKKSGIFKSLDSFNIFFPEKINFEDNVYNKGINFSMSNFDNYENDNDNDNYSEISKNSANKINSSIFKKD